MSCKKFRGVRKITKVRTKYFWHQMTITLTSNGYIWTYPGKKLSKKSICVLPETKKTKIKNFISGICSDYIEKYKRKYD